MAPRRGAARSGPSGDVAYSLLASAAINQLEPFAYLRDVIDQLSHQEAASSAVESLLPDRWPASHTSSCRRAPH
jgi:streptogramin lyase